MNTLKQYEVIGLPGGDSLSDSTLQEIEAFNDWFVHAIPERILNLECMVNKNKLWTANFSIQSIEDLCVWFYDFLNKDPRSDKLKNDINVSVALDISMYFGETLIKEIEGLEWRYQVNQPKYVDYGKPVISGKDKVPFSVSQVLLTYLVGFDEFTDEDRLYNVFGFWRKELSQ